MNILDVNLPYEEILARRDPLDRAYRFKKLTVFRFWHLFTPVFTWKNLEKALQRKRILDPEVMLEVQCQGKAWVLNNVQTDFTELDIGAVDMGHYYESWALGCELDFDDFPRGSKSHPIRTEQDLTALAAIDINDNPMTVHEDKMRKRMTELAGDYALRFADDKLVYPAEGIRPPNGTVGLFTLAADLRGSEIYLDTMTNPDMVERLMEIVTDKVIQRLSFVRREFGYPVDGSYICDDASAQLSPAAYRRFVLPYNRRLKEHFGGKLTLHCCGRAGHLVPIWANELGVDILWNFSFETDRRKVAQLMGGKAALIGNVNWKLINAGTQDEIYSDARDTIEVFCPYGGHILSAPNIRPFGFSRKPEYDGAGGCGCSWREGFVCVGVREVFICFLANQKSII